MIYQIKAVSQEQIKTSDKVVFHTCVLSTNENSDGFDGELKVKSQENSKGSVIYPFYFNRENLLLMLCKVHANNDLIYIVYPLFEGIDGFYKNDAICQTVETMLRMYLIGARDITLMNLKDQSQSIEKTIDGIKLEIDKIRF
ncbi:hypothetical protein Kuja_0700 [Vibrio phage vB_VchM_Kuja]|uniref:Uncharacterized protein n=1 Tax=Vibrio phage vB_VchM_Kuja TaxID=2686437 RepID=A0A6B9J5C4_9CAUD|nr:hypothetical protein HWC83_gp166 [Vibrio phage vB_VchM_Kuja]QGZ16061.1 hypothetical protein Kuja_0700 [Vibrio phage vB_VchM_Kuja]